MSVNPLTGMFVVVCMCVCVSACMCVCMCVHVYMCVYVCMLYLPFNESFYQLLGTFFVDLFLGGLFVKDMVECEGLVRAHDADLGLIRYIRNTF